MSRPGLSPVDLTRLAPPEVIRELDYETIVREMRDRLVELFPPIVNVIDLESQPARKLIECFAYYTMLVYGRVNDSARAVLPSLAHGADLDHLAALLGVTRLVVTPGANGQPNVMETDERLLRRMQLAPSAFGTAGAEEAYCFFALTAAPTLADVTAIKTAPGEVLVTLLGATAAQPTAGELEAARAMLNRKDVRPLTDVVAVSGPAVKTTPIVVRFKLYPGPSETALVAESRARLTAWRTRMRALGLDLTRSAVGAIAFVEGMHSVDVVSPAADVHVAPNEVVEVSAITVSSLGVDE